jgi:phenylacetate-coenzyme A ligase PaaK-like adenylate-forming protein
VFNTYGSTEGTMCGECNEINGLHVPEDLVHLDVYDPSFGDFVDDGECGRIVLSTLLPVGGKTGTLLLNYDTEDTTVVMSRSKCCCGRTHLKILNPQREAETVWVFGSPFNRVDIERGVFQRENMEYLTGEYEAFLEDGKSKDENVLSVDLECLEKTKCDIAFVKENFLKGFFKFKPKLEGFFSEGRLKIELNFLGLKQLKIFKVGGRPKRLVDRRIN